MNHCKLNESYPDAKILSVDPLVCVMDNFIDADLCKHLIYLAKPNMERASVAQNGATEKSDVRTNQVTFLQHGSDLQLQALVDRIANLVGIPSSHAEALQMIYYQLGQQYKPHFDTFSPDDSGQHVFLEKSGQRLLTALLYLCDVDLGGETTFPGLGIDVSPKMGRMVIFHSCEQGTNSPHQGALHGGMPILQGEKWAANLWFRESPFVG